MIIITGEFHNEPFYFIEGEWRRSMRPTFEGYPDYDAARNLAVALANTALHVSGDNCDIRVIDTDAEIDPRAELSGLCPNCHGDNKSPKTPTPFFTAAHAGACGAKAGRRVFWSGKPCR